MDMSNGGRSVIAASYSLVVSVGELMVDAIDDAQQAQVGGC